MRSMYLAHPRGEGRERKAPDEGGEGGEGGGRGDRGGGGRHRTSPQVPTLAKSTVVVGRSGNDRCVYTIVSEPVSPSSLSTSLRFPRVMTVPEVSGNDCRRAADDGWNRTRVASYLCVYRG